jgi:hypothetical protein
MTQTRLPFAPAVLRRCAVGAAAALFVGVAPPVSAQPVRPSFTTECGAMNVTIGARKCTYTFRYTQTMETFVVPPTTEPILITAIGAPGAGDRGFRSRGARVTGSFADLGGKPIFVTVGGEGWFDGYNGGGQGGGGGGSDVRLGTPDLNHRVIIAGGGGGMGEKLLFDADSGEVRFLRVKGGDAGQSGEGAGGAAGGRIAGGSGGGTDPAQGEPGRIGKGGTGGDGVSGGGGGGLFGGGGGGGCAGEHCAYSAPGSGGGGSSLVPSGGALTVSEDVEPKVIITVMRYGWWGVP